MVISAGAGHIKCSLSLLQVFCANQEREVTRSHAFHDNGIDGIYPKAGVIMDEAGNLYGTTEGGGTGTCYGNGCGTVFELAPDGAETILYSFTGGDGAFPGSLIRDQAGNLYGTTSEGGTYDSGTIFELSPDGTETLLYSFHGGGDGAFPMGGVIADSAGNLYGAAEGGGGSHYGVVFKLAPDGTETVLHSFTGSDGAYPTAGVILDKSGNLYGTASYGGECRRFKCGGTVFKLAPDGTLTVLHAFEKKTGANPQAPLMAGENGYLYGTASDGGDGIGCNGHPHSKGCGTVFRLKK
jgi:uncharacterized repeat protein (TIGR03803 family)